MTAEQDADAAMIRAQIYALIASLYEDLGPSIRAKAFGSVDGLCLQISELSKAYGHVASATLDKTNQ
jgi:hypothetical protein